MRIGGIASGMDTDQIITDLMNVERMKVDKVEQDKTRLEWKQEEYNAVNKDYANFILDTKKEFGLTSTTSTGLLLNKSVESLDWVKSATSSDESIATVSTQANAVRGTQHINVTQLAENFSAASSSSISSGDKGNVASQFSLANDDTIKFTIETNKDTKEFTYTGLDGVSLSDIVTEINSANLGVTAVYDSDIDRFFIQTDNTGSENTMKITDVSTLSGGGNLDFITGGASKLKLNYDKAGVSTSLSDATEYKGQDAQIDFGEAKNIEKSSNQFTINGIEFDLKNIGAFDVKVETDVDSIYDKISNFVEKYNEIVESTGSKLVENKNREFSPLTDEQKEAMSDEDIERWEEKARSGLLRNDSIVTRTMQNIRSGLYENVSGVTGSYEHITEIGITTQQYSSGSSGGKLQIDESKLKETIQNDVDGVLELLFKQSDITGSESSLTGAEITQKREESGLISRMYDNMVSGMTDIVNKAGRGDNENLYRNVSRNILLDFVTEQSNISMISKDIYAINDRLDDLEMMLINTEDRYYSRFTAMEKALDQMNGQSEWLSQQMGGM